MGNDLASICTTFSRMVVREKRSIPSGGATVRKQSDRLQAGTGSWSRAALAFIVRQDIRYKPKAFDTTGSIRLSAKSGGSCVSAFAGQARDKQSRRSDSFGSAEAPTAIQ
jgi:hypothetical protein